MEARKQLEKTESGGVDEKPMSSVCAGCPDSDQCRKVWSASNRGPFTAVGLSLSSMVVFLLPLAGAIFAGGLMRTILEKPSTFWEIVAAVAGLVVGIVLARMIMPLIRKRFYVSSEKDAGS
ncbi:MAG: SoxR reducing system RseC family protein [Sedimentisphaerales bacterium]|nr:SoxR reducing system RseC family protein [Sedimentisphaerales bacterium]